jgi:hypothetical protein
LTRPAATASSSSSLASTNAPPSALSARPKVEKKDKAQSKSIMQVPAYALWHAPPLLVYSAPVRVYSAGRLLMPLCCPLFRMQLCITHSMCIL